MARGVKTDPAVKAAVLARLALGEMPAEIARTTGLDKSTVSRWASASPGLLQQVATQKQTDFGELFTEYMVDLLMTARVHQEFFRNETWLRRQNASDMAILHGVCIDKGIRLFEARERAAAASKAE